MIIYTDILNGDELISDVFDFIEPKDGGGALWEIDGQMIVPGKDNIVLEGANASAEGEDADEGGEDGNNAPVLNFKDLFRLQKMDAAPSKALYSAELKLYMKNVAAKKKERGDSEEEIAEFKKGAQAAAKKILGNYKNYDVYLGESAESDGQGQSMLVLVDFRDDGMTPYATVWKHGLHGMKV